MCLVLFKFFSLLKLINNSLVLMEHCLPHLLSHAEMLLILKERQLNIPNMEQLPHEDILRIYSTFAMPLVKRESRTHGNARNIDVLEKTTADRLHATKRPQTLDADMAELDLHELHTAKRSKQSNDHFKKVLTEDVFGIAAKKRKLITWP